MNFSLSRNQTNINNLMNELKKMQPLMDFFYNIHPPYTANHNVVEIRDLIKAYDNKLGTITPDLTFQGNIKQEVKNYLEVYYKGFDQNFAIPLKTM